MENARDAVQRQLTLDEIEDKVTQGVYTLSSSCMLESDLKPHKASDMACAILFVVRRSLGE
jgi:hypothetical protein